MTPLAERAERLATTFAGVNVARRFPLLLEVPLETQIRSLLSVAVSAYIFASLRHSYPEQSLPAVAGWLETYRELILTLVNRTPNGRLEPKREVALEFDMVQKCVELIFSGWQIDAAVDLMQFPIAVRVQDGRPDPSIENRPYATSKVHTDIWTGEPAICGAVLIPVLGDVEATGLEFYEPRVASVEEFVQTYRDYLDVARFVDGARPYGAMREGYAYIFDSFCLHRTAKNNGGIRVSIDFRFTFKRKLPSDIDRESWRLQQYIELERWYTARSATFVEPQDTFEDTIRKFGRPAASSIAPGSGAVLITRKSPLAPRA